MTSFKLFRNNELFWAFCLAVTLVFFEMPAWAQGASLICIVWRLLIERAQFPIPPKRAFGVLVVLLLGLVWVEYRTFLGKDAAGTLFFVLLTFKALESKSDRDRRFLWLITLGLAHVRFLYSFEVYALPLAQIVVMLVLLDILKQSWPVELALRLRFILRSMFLTSPLVLALFFLFPRTQSPWGFVGKSKAVSGFSESLNAGEISEVSLSNELAFRARFIDGERRKLSQLYWVGSRFYKSEGLSWKKSSNEYKPILKDKAGASNYEIHLEPHNKNWLFALLGTEVLRNSDSRTFDLRLREDGVFRTRFPVEHEIFYEGVLGSLPDVQVGPELLQTPSMDSDLRQYLKEQIRQRPNRTAQVQEVKMFFLRNNFAYTLKPEKESEDLREFLLESKKGFCGHFAGAAASILRMYGVPTRVALGYQGGIYNHYGDFWSVFQRDAHAWVEYLNEQNQWIVFDLVAFMAPLRIDFGASEFSNMPSEFASNPGSRLRQISWSRQVWEDFLFFIENLNYQWTIFLIEFNKSNQQQVLREMLPFVGWALVLVVSLLFLNSLIKLWLVANRKPIVEKFMTFIEAETAAKGLVRSPTETPLFYFEKCRQHWPRSENMWKKVVEIYVDISLREKRSSENISQVLRQLRKDIRSS